MLCDLLPIMCMLTVCIYDAENYFFLSAHILSSFFFILPRIRIRVDFKHAFFSAAHCITEGKHPLPTFTFERQFHLKRDLAGRTGHMLSFLPRCQRHMRNPKCGGRVVTFRRGRREGYVVICRGSNRKSGWDKDVMADHSIFFGQERATEI